MDETKKNILNRQLYEMHEALNRIDTIMRTDDMPKVAIKPHIDTLRKNLFAFHSELDAINTDKPLIDIQPLLQQTHDMVKDIWRTISEAVPEDTKRYSKAKALLEAWCMACNFSIKECSLDTDGAHVCCVILPEMWENVSPSETCQAKLSDREIQKVQKCMEQTVSKIKGKWHYAFVPCVSEPWMLSYTKANQDRILRLLKASFGPYVTSPHNVIFNSRQHKHDSRTTYWLLETSIDIPIEFLEKWYDNL